MFVKQSCLLFLLIVGITSCIWKISTKAKHQFIPEALEAGDKKCEKCHKNQRNHTINSPHKILFDDGKGCEKCHGMASLHLASTKNPDLIFGFRNMDSRKASQICLSCHQEGTLERFLDIKHFKEGVSCPDCHRIHSNRRNKLLVGIEPSLCFVCHPKIKESFSLKHGHDIDNPRLKCKGCHGIHNFREIERDKNETRDICLSCHEVIEEDVRIIHPPVEDSCTKCHAPHGSDEKGILTIGMPDLCYACHKMKNHVVPIAKRMPMGPQGTDKCIKCHMKIHGGELNRFFERIGPPVMLNSDFIWAPNPENIPDDAPIRNIQGEPSLLEKQTKDFTNDENF